MSDYPIPDVIRESPHRHDDDLLTAGLGLAGLRDPRKPAFTDATTPTPTELRRRAIHASWRAIADLEPTGGFGEIYGQAPRIPGREYHAFARLPGAQTSHRVLLQAPDDFDRRIRCLIVTASPGSRGIYGGIALAGAWGLPRGCAVVYTDKGAGSGYFDAHSGSGVRLDGTRVAAGEDVLEFEPLIADPEGGIGIKHAHSGDNPEASWGDHVLQALNFGLAMLDRAYPDAAPFSPENTRIIATGLSNGGAAILQAAGRDTANQLDGAVAISPNVLTPNRGRAFYDYTSEVALLIGSALAAPSLLGIAQARHADAMPDHVAWGEGLAEAGVLSTNRPAEYAEEALSRLHTMGWSTAALQAALLTGDTEIWRAAGAAYAGSYLRRPMGELPCEEGFLARVPDTQGQLRPAGALLRSTWWADAPGIPPSLGVVPASLAAGRPLIKSLLCLYALSTESTDEDAPSRVLRTGIEAAAVSLPHEDLPLWLVHGDDDGLVPVAFSSLPYVDWLRTQGRQPVLWRIPHVQHFDALLGWPALAARYLPMLAYAYAALDALWARIGEREPMAGGTVALPSRVRGAAALTPAHLGLDAVNDKQHLQ